VPTPNRVQLSLLLDPMIATGGQPRQRRPSEALGLRERISTLA